jgi:hypothetical protein
VALAPSGTQAMTLDIAKFHRTAPIHPEHKPWFVVQTNQGFFLDHVCPFGGSSSSSNAGMIGNAIADIWTCEGVGPVLKYEDDLAILRTPTSSPSLYSYDRPSALKAIEPLRVPWHPDKGQDFAATFAYIGFLWDFDNKRASLPENKRLKFLLRTSTFLTSFAHTRCQILDVMKIHGSLCHIAFIFPLGRSRLASLSNFIASFKGDNPTPFSSPRPLMTNSYPKFIL